MQRLRPILTAYALSALLLAGCASEKTKDDALAANQLYQQIQANIAAGNYKTAMERLHTLQSRFPFDTFGTQAELDLIYTSYLNQDYDGAEDAADRFIREHPRHPDVDYAYYMKGVAYFDPDVELLQKWLKYDNFQRDPTNAQKSFEAFRTLLQRYPDSRYAADARQRMIFLRERLANFDWIVADWYMRRGAWISAIQRADNIVRHYPQTPRVEDALQIMITAYTKLGMTELAADSAKVLEKNFPGAKPEYTPRGPV
ncbi:MAG TPA: outer membrane protein assembly factor BamD [Gammaproteobacteria bacterium]|nr:outer membrane protein assembly factor BamD [Gammaproteobacteria bacterium]